MTEIDARSLDDGKAQKPTEMSASGEGVRSPLTGVQEKPGAGGQRKSSPGTINNRPPSTTSNQSNASSSGAPRPTTATSRRGGRIRSRSPPAMAYSSASTANESGPSESRGSPKNPSSAAAAAAAAAKALSSSAGSRNQQLWYDGQGRPDRRPDNSKYPLDNNYYPGSRGWPGEGGGRGYGPSGGRPQPYPQNRPMPQVEGYGPGVPGPFGQPVGYDGSQPFGFDGQNRYGSYDESSAPPGTYGPDGQQRGHRQQGHDYYKGPAGMAPAGGDPFMNQSGSGPGTPAKRGGTSRVMGTPTPIHVPRASEPKRPTYSGSSASSVFRGRPGEEAPAEKSAPEDDSAQRILLSLRTPSTSFEEKDGNKAKKDSSRLPLSPADPPQIQHSHNQSNVDIFEKSPKQGGNLEMAGSFSLFNQSFDSLGDTAHYLTGPLDSAFQSNSFGAGPTPSGENEQTVLLPNPMSMGGGQYLGPAGSSGALTFGMSPVNSFGNGPPTGQPRVGGSMMVLGGADGRSASPTQVLGMYPSYSGGYQPAQAPFRQRNAPAGPEDHVRNLGSGSFGGPSMSQVFTRSFEHSPHGAYGGPMIPGPSHSMHDLPNGPPVFYAFLKRNKGAFIKCSFLLPGLKAALLEAPSSDTKEDKTMLNSSFRGYGEPTPQDTEIAIRRVKCAVCAFGGGTPDERSLTTPINTKSSSGGSQSIFRERDNSMEESAATVTPSSSTGTPPGSRFQTRSKMRYDEMLPSRYYENENRLSWEFEESPPVETGSDELGESKKKRNKDETKIDDAEASETVEQVEAHDYARDFMAPLPEHGSSDGSTKSPDKKMRYRCKLCGQPKQNHVCPFQKSLQRSIGTMIYPAVNAFTAHEPGLVAPALSDMNNFVLSGSESISSGDHSPPGKTPRGRRGKHSDTSPSGKAPNVTPEGKSKGKVDESSPESIKSMTSDTSQKVLQTPKRMVKGTKSASSTKSGSSSSMSSTSLSRTPRGRKRQYTQLMTGGSDDQDLLFVDAVELRPEQFRTVTTPKKPFQPDAFTYPALPLPYAQRKRLSDNLFSLSKEVPKLTDECAVVLREAREKDMWDLAVAELMTQVVIVIHCPEGDTRFEGLRQYLLTLGIAC